MAARASGFGSKLWSQRLANLVIFSRETVDSWEDSFDHATRRLGLGVDLSSMFLAEARRKDVWMMQGLFFRFGLFLRA